MSALERHGLVHQSGERGMLEPGPAILRFAHRGAVERNRVKRLLREAFRLGKSELPIGLDLVVVPRGPALTFDAARQGLPALARAISRRLGPRTRPVKAAP